MTEPHRRRGTFERADCTLYYEVTGEGPAVIFAHGLGGNHMSWFQQVAHFAPTHRCVTFAHRGFFPSAGAADPAEYAGDMAALVAHLGLGDHVIVAQSMGGWTSIEYALTRPAGLRGVVLAATTGTINPGLIAAAFQPRLAAWQAESAIALAGFARDGIHPAVGARMAAEQPAMHMLYKHIDDQNAALDKNALRQKLMEGRTRAPDVLSGCVCPILMLANEEDMVMPLPALEAVAAANANARFASIPKAGHSGYFERPVVFNSLVEGFLAGVG